MVFVFNYIECQCLADMRHPHLFSIYVFLRTKSELSEKSDFLSCNCDLDVDANAIYKLETPLSYECGMNQLISAHCQSQSTLMRGAAA